MEKKKIYYGWITVAGCTMIMATAMGIVFNCASLFIKPIAEDLGYSRSAVQMISTVFNIGNMAVSFLAGKIFTENNIVKLMKVSILVMVCCYFMNSMVSSIYLFYLIALINSVCMTLLTTMPISFIINNWFYEKGGLALGLASMGSGIGSAIFSALSGVWLTTMGWRNTYRLLALFVAVIAIPAVFFLVKLRPQDMGLEPYGKKAEGQQAAQNTGMSAKEVRKKPVFWILVVIAGLLGISMSAMYGNIAPHLSDIGYSTSFSANVLSVGMVALTGGKLLLGRIFDKVGVRNGFAFACLCLFGGLVAMLFAKSWIALAFLIISMGFGVSFGAVCFPLMLPAVFGKESYRSIIGIVSAVLALGSAVAPSISGWIYDSFGTYNAAFIGGAVIMAAVTVIVWLVLPKKENEIK